MARRPTPLPTDLIAAAFNTRAAAVEGITESRLRARDLHAPFAGVRAAHPPALTALELARDYLPRLVEGQFFSHVTAAVLHGLWLPWHIERELLVHVAVHKPQRAPRGQRVRGHHLVQRPGVVEVWRGIPVSDPVETWCQLATVLAVQDLVIAGDSLLARGRADVQETLARMRAAADDRHRPRVDLIRRALARVRVGSRSPGETRTRLVLVDGGLPEPALNVAIEDDLGRFVAEGDLVYVRERVWIEYEGDGHRTDARQFRKDIHRYEQLQDLGWRVVRVTADDPAQRPDELVRRVRRLLQA